jgi:hypothetical protein
VETSLYCLADLSKVYLLWLEHRQTALLSLCQSLSAVYLASASMMNLVSIQSHFKGQMSMIVNVFTNKLAVTFLSISKPMSMH